MGMSASQARYLQLTARRSNLEFEAQQICQARMMLAQHTDEIAARYTERINDRHLYFRAMGEDTFGLTSSQRKRLDYYDIVNSPTNESQPGLGMRIVDANGKIVVPAFPEPEMDENGNVINPINYDDYIIDATIAFNSSAGGELYENSCNYLEQKLRDGEWFLEQSVMQSVKTESGEDEEEYVWTGVNYTTSTNIDDLLYTENDSAAQADYKTETESLQKQDKMLELRLQEINTEQEAVKTELESAKKIIDENIEKSFKTFA